mgnify:CR=1 FL=1
MTSLLLQQQVDALTIAAPGERGYGYADTQHPWHHDPAVDLPRQAWIGWLEATLRRRFPDAPDCRRARRGGPAHPGSRSGRAATAA